MLHFTVGDAVHVAKRMQDIFQHLEHGSGFHVASIRGCKKTARGHEHVVLVVWIGPDDEEAIWESTRLMQKIPRLL